LPVDVEKLAETFVELADTLVDAFDVLDLLHVLSSRCVDLLDVDAAGILLAEPAGRLRVTVATSQDARLLDRFQLRVAQGPAVECFRGGAPVIVERLEAADHRWPRFAKEASGRGYTSVAALPMRLRDEVIGVLTLFSSSRTAPVSGSETRVAQAMANSASIAIIQYRLTEERRVLSEQLERALESRVMIEQAKGVLASRLQVSEDEAFRLLRQRARASRRLLTDVADEVRNGVPDTDWDAYRSAGPPG